MQGEPDARPASPGAIQQISATERASAETVAAPLLTPSGRLVVRELPVISVDLRSVSIARDVPLLTEPTGRDLEIVSMLGEGGMARVYLARQHSLQRDVAIKTLHENASAAQRNALLEEGVITGFLEHPGVVPVHALGLDASDRPVLVMKRVEGVAWSDLLRDPDHPAWQTRGGDPGARLDDHVEILRQVCNAAHFAHSRGIIHRDIKPQNVLIGRFGDVYLADWGIAYRAGSSSANGICGTPGYMAPEMLLSEEIDARTDVYLLGATLHEILTGRALHVSTKLHDILREIEAEEPHDYGPGVPAPLVDIVRRATARDPEARYASAAAFHLALTDYARHKSSISLASSALERLPRLRILTASAQTDEASQRELDQLIAELRFGLTQAVEQWSANPAAAEGLAELEALLASRRQRAAEMARIALDHDPRIGARLRAMGQAALALAGCAVAVSALAKGVYHEPSARELILEGMLPFTVLILVVLFLRPRIQWTSLNRHITTLGLVVVTGIVLERILAAHGGVSAAQILSHNALAISSLLVVSSNQGYRWFSWVAIPMFCTALVCAFLPTMASFCFALGTGLTFILIMLITLLAPRSDPGA
jgi:serine/threonine protein kinase